MNTPLISALIQNAALLLAMVVAFDIMTSYAPMRWTLFHKVLAGAAVGAIGIAMIALAVPFDAGLLFDTRSVLLAVAGLFLGAIPTAIAILMTGAFRLALGGASAATGVAVIVASGLIGLGWRYARRAQPRENTSWQELYALGIVVHVVMLGLMFTLPGRGGQQVITEIGFAVMTVHPIATLAIGLLFVQRLRSLRAVAALAVSENRFRLLAENARDVVFRFDMLPQPRFTYMSPSCRRLFGYEPEDYYADSDLGRKVVHPEDRPLLEAARRGAVPPDEPVVLRWIRKDGEVVWTEQWNTLIRDEKGEVIASEGIVRDITPRRLAEEERLKLMAQLHESQKIESLGRLAGGVAHELNNVLAAILSSAEARRNAISPSDPTSRTLEAIINASVRGRTVVRSLLYFSRPVIETRGPVDLNETCGEIAELLGRTTFSKIHFVTDLEKSLPAVEGDSTALTHALMNVCINAIDAMPEGGDLTIRTRTTRDGLVEVAVVDSGTGMPPDVQARAVEPFFTTKEAGKGTGLGLAIAYGAAKAHEGRLEIDSTPGEGTEVRLLFPVALGVAPKDEQPETLATATSNDGVLRVLLVDDDDLVRAGVTALLEICGYEVHTSVDGALALKQLEAGLDPDVVILDVSMPGLTGPETLDRLLVTRPHQRVLMASGFGDEPMLRAMAGRPNVLSIQKPFTLEELEARLGELTALPVTDARVV